MFYGLSAPLYQWIGAAKLRGHHITGPEDVRTAQFLLSLDESNPNERLERLHLDGRLSDLKYVGGQPEDFDPRSLLAIHAFRNESTLQRILRKLGDRV